MLITNYLLGVISEMIVMSAVTELVEQLVALVIVSVQLAHHSSLLGLDRGNLSTQSNNAISPPLTKLIDNQLTWAAHFVLSASLSFSAHSVKP